MITTKTKTLERPIGEHFDLITRDTEAHKRKVYNRAYYNDIDKRVIRLYNRFKKQYEGSAKFTAVDFIKFLKAELHTFSTADLKGRNLTCIDGKTTLLSNSELAANRRKVRTANHKSPATQYKGVTEHYKGFKARIYYQGKEIYLGIHQTAEKAAEVYDAKALELYGPNVNNNKRLGLLIF